MSIEVELERERKGLAGRPSYRNQYEAQNARDAALERLAALEKRPGAEAMRDAVAALRGSVQQHYADWEAQQGGGGAAGPVGGDIGGLGDAWLKQLQAEDEIDQEHERRMASSRKLKGKGSTAGKGKLAAAPGGHAAGELETQRERKNAERKGTARTPASGASLNERLVNLVHPQSGMDISTPALASPSVGDPMTTALPFVTLKALAVPHETHRAMLLRAVPLSALATAADVRQVPNEPLVELCFAARRPVDASEVEGATASALPELQAQLQAARKQDGGKARRSPSLSPATVLLHSTLLQPGASYVCETRADVYRPVLSAMWALLQTRRALLTPAASSTGPAVAGAKAEAEPDMGLRALTGEEADVFAAEIPMLAGGRGSAEGHHFGPAEAEGEGGEGGALSESSSEAAFTSTSSDDDADADADPQMPPRDATVTQEFHSPVGAAEEEEDDDVVLQKASAALVAQHAADEAQRELEADTAATVPSTIPAGALTAMFASATAAPWVVLMCQGGYFAGAVYVQGVPVLHKTFHRYIVRKKQGGKQSNQERTAGSAGSQIRKAQEVKFREDVMCILHSWRALIDASWFIMYAAPSPSNRRLLTEFDPQVVNRGVQEKPREEAHRQIETILRRVAPLQPSSLNASPVSLADPRVRSVPLTTKRPSFAEVQRIFETVSRCTVRLWFHRVSSPTN